MSRRSPLLAFGQAPTPLVDAIRTLETQPMLPSFTVAQLQAIAVGALEQGMMTYCSNESGGAQPVFFDGTNWRRVTDRAVIS